MATAAAVALTAGMTSPVSAKPEPADGGSTAAEFTAKHRITLITGDRVLVDAKGRPVGLERAKGRESIPVQLRQVDGHTLVVPADAAGLIAEGKLDQRLFDITELNSSVTRKAQKKGLKVIVGYKGAATGARAGVRGAGDTTVRRTLKTLNADAVLTPKGDVDELWNAVTDTDGTTASGIAKVWLDGVRKASLDKSVPQIGAPKAWEAGYDGKGVKIAVLDTGVDTTHPDLEDQVIESRNFTSAADASDKYGHGTHVASIAAGTGAKSGGTYKGVAPGAKILNGKVLDDTGSGDDSGVIAGIEWAVAQGADVVNLSFGGRDTPEVDALEAQVNEVSAEKGTLFAVAAGNSGENGEQTVGSPGTAAAALTVGAVDDNDQLASFSSRGPGLDGRIKPDVTAPGSAITAASAKGSVIEQENGENPAGYLTISGTSMATPHVAGAAAILKQQHPDWTYVELKGALTGSTKGGEYTPFQQGSGRVQVDQAVRQTVFADPVSVTFGAQQWPHTDNTPVTKAVTYRNTGTRDVTLDLAVAGKDPAGQAAPAGFFTLGTDTVTVPAGGTASVDLTADTRLGSTVTGVYSAYVTATGGGQTVRTAATVEREEEAYDVTFRTIGRDGNPAVRYELSLVGLSGLAKGEWFNPNDPSGTVKARVPAGDYLLDFSSFVDPRDTTKGIDWLAQPELSVTGDTTITLDARTAEPVDITVPDRAATAKSALAEYTLSTTNGAGYAFGWWLASYKDFRTAHLGPQLTEGSLYQKWGGHWTKGDDSEYDAVDGAEVKRLATGHTKHWRKSELSTVKVDMGASTNGKYGAVRAWGYVPGSSSASAIAIPQALPGTRTLHVSATDGVKWYLDFDQIAGFYESGQPIVDATYQLGTAQTFKAGRTYEKTFNVGVFGPWIGPVGSAGGYYGISRDGNTISGYLPMFADGRNNAGASLYTSVKSTLHRNGTKIGENEDPLEGGRFEVPADEARYRLTTSVERSAEVAAASTRVDASWTFKSEETGSATELPVSTARFDAPLDLTSRAPAARTARIPVTVQGAAAGDNLKSLAVYVSYDGQSWTRLTVRDGKVTVKNPAKGKGISFHTRIADRSGNKSTVTIHNAYYGK